MPKESARRRLRVLLISGSFPPMQCGVGDYTAALARSLAHTNQLDVGVLTHVDAGHRTDETVKVLGVADGWRPSDAFRIWRTIDQWRPDIVHLQYPSQGYGRRLLPWLIPSLIALRGIPVVQTWHEYYRSFRGSRKNMLNAVLAGGLIAVRPNYREEMPRLYRWLIRRKRFCFVPNASALPVAKLDQSDRAALRSGVSGEKALVAYFGFALPSKGIEQLFQIVDPDRHHLLLICDLRAGDPYHEQIMRLLRGDRWMASATVTGFLPANTAASLLAAADAVILPFRGGGGEWNTSLHAARSQGTFVLTTSTERIGYSPDENVYYAHPGDIVTMRRALSVYIGNRSPSEPRLQEVAWRGIAAAHLGMYRELTGFGAREAPRLAVTEGDPSRSGPKSSG